ncbi:MAG: hypothetical protein ONB48_01225 [candidate division KSB1 bacterium]|nr:hypothetical protein [candidate division KSB1 bacterium]MDZ7272701.1 hypothetical protein [candidate division KSB1 bacterium]MDZ7284276.1 hypothetical protein [candidate division KSB1 bacterium]MDZ7297328.1 hypothetical protein [candidate division KSB1 bacterium]MDZ7308396.1 hypothetical protein [candidate division KSB1 bacterium]
MSENVRRDRCERREADNRLERGVGSSWEVEPVKRRVDKTNPGPCPAGGIWP